MLECIGQRKERNALNSKGIAPLARNIATGVTCVVVEHFGKGVVAEDIVTKSTAVAAQGILHAERVVETVEAPGPDVAAQVVESEQASQQTSSPNTAVSRTSKVYWQCRLPVCRRVDQRVKTKSRVAL